MMKTGRYVFAIIVAIIKVSKSPLKSLSLSTEPFPEYGIVIIVLGTIIIVVLVAAFFIYR